MARIEQLVEGVQDEQLRRQIEAEISALKERTRFGLVYERHLPETALIADPDLIEIGVLVRPKRDVDKETNYRVVGFKGKKTARLTVDGNGKELEAPVSDLFVVKPFGDAIYPALTPVDVVERSTERPYHAVINGENFHALQLLAYLYEGQVDCLYLDPPYNTGARDWKYNNRYVDDNDSYRHSKWLSMMEKRLRIARRLLKQDSVLIITIDENELHHLGVLLEDIFPAARRQLVTICINPGGASGGEGLSRVEEYAFFCFFGGAQPAATEDDMLVSAADTDAAHTGARGIRWEWLMRGGNAWYRASRQNLCYPIILDESATRIVGAGEPLEDADEDRPSEIDGKPLAWPVRRDGKLGIWRVDAAKLMHLVGKGYAFVSARDEARGTWTVKYLMSGTVESIESGLVEVIGHGERGEVQVRVSERRGKTAKTMWNRGRHVAGGAGGTHLLNALLGERNVFPFPKSVYAVRDCLEIAVGEKPNALVVDFFAGSGTTLNATCLLNAEDGGARRTIMITNNEVNPELTRKLNKAGHSRGDAEFERHGIFDAATMPRCKAAISGKRADGKPVEGAYLDGRSFSEGFEENAAFLRLDYLNPDTVELGDAFDTIHPLLWLAAGAHGSRPEPLAVDSKDFFVSESGRYAVLFNDAVLHDLQEELVGRDDISHLYVVTDSPDAYAEAVELLGRGRKTSMLYRDYLRNFRINTPQSV
jgi:adenine-specific DNA-methyltransferase